MTLRADGRTCDSRMLIISYSAVYTSYMGVLSQTVVMIIHNVLFGVTVTV